MRSMVEGPSEARLAVGQNGASRRPSSAFQAILQRQGRIARSKSVLAKRVSRGYQARQAARGFPTRRCVNASPPPASRAGGAFRTSGLESLEGIYGDG